MKKFLLMFMFFFLAAAGVMYAQEMSVSGKITDGSSGDPIPGANVVEKGTSNGTVTDIDGNYKLSVQNGATLVVSFIGYATQEVAVGSRGVVDVSLAVDVTELSEVVVVGYGSQDKKEITSSVVALSEKEFNKGNINDATQLLQGKVPGLSVYNKGGNPNANSTIRLRGISTVGTNSSPLVVVDGVIGASLDNVDPNDIESVNVLKDGSAAAIYGSRGSSGVILVTTKQGSKSGQTSVTYNGYIAAATVQNPQPVFSAGEYIAAGGNDLGSNTDWQKEVTRTGITNVHNIAVSGGTQNTNFRFSTNVRNVDGILKKSGFDQINNRASLNHSALDNKLNLSFNMSLTNRESDFSFNEALRYAVLYNPTAPVRFDNGEYYQAILFDNFNPVAILDQNSNTGKRKNLNFNTQASYAITDNLSVTANYGQQFTNEVNREYYSRASLWRGFNRGGLARRYIRDTKFTLFETYATYSKSLDRINLDVTGGYSFQEDQDEDIFLELGNFPNDELGGSALEDAGDRLSGRNDLTNISSSLSPENRIIAFFGRVNLTFDNAIFFNASVRREGSTRLGEDNQYGIFPALGLGIDLQNYLQLGGVDVLKLRVGYGVTGSLPSESGLSKRLWDYSVLDGGNRQLVRDANPDLGWEEKSEINLGIDFGLGGKLTGALDVYTRDVTDFVLQREPNLGQEDGPVFDNNGKLQTRGAELSLNYNSIAIGEVRWTPGVVLSTYKTTLEEFPIDEQVRANLGAPGQNGTNVIRVKVGEEIGQIWGPVFEGVESNGAPRFADLNGDGVVNANPGSALEEDGDFQELGNGIPDLELGWTNQVTYKNWDFNVFFRAAFGHSLVNTYRAFYEPIDPGAINSYNRISTDEAVDGLTSAQYSSLYVEKADFFRLDNMTLGYTFNTSKSSLVRNLRVYANVQNAFTITGYTGIDPEPILQDFDATDNGGFPDTTPDVLAPGVDRRNNYFTARTFTFGVSLGL